MGLMASKVSRNAPCPCGSGKKHKHCCLGKTSPAARRKFLSLVAAAIVVTGVGASVTFYYSSATNAFFAAIGGLIFIGGFSILRHAPASQGRAGSDRIDFGK